MKVDQEVNDKKAKQGSKKRKLKLTVSRALSDQIETRERSLASVKRARQKELKNANKDENNGILILDSKVDSVGVCDKIGALRVDLTTMMFKKFPGKNDKVEKITIPALRVNSC